MSNIPRARVKLRAVAKKLRKIDGDLAKQVLSAIDDLYREKAVRRMAVKSKPVTPKIKARIIELAESTDMHSNEIAHELGVNPGRVSEVLHGDY